MYVRRTEGITVKMVRSSRSLWDQARFSLRDTSCPLWLKIQKTPTTKYTNVHEEGSPVRRSVATMEKRFVPQQGFHAFDHMLGVSLGDSAAHSDVAGLINQLA